MSGLCREVLTLQLGHYSNYVGTHWWNLQDASLSYDPDAPLGEIQSDVVFREGQTSGGHATYTPRLIAMDLKGSLRTLRQEGSLYDPGKDTSAASWEGNLMLHKESPPSKNPFLEDLDTIDKGEILAESDSSFSPPHCSAAAVTVDSVNTQLSKLQKSYRLEGSVRVWSDFLRIHLHPRTISVVHQYNHDGEAHRLEAFAQGESLLQGPVLEDLEDRLHFFVEECDYLQGFQVFCDLADGFSGLGSKVTELLQDSYSGRGILTWGLAPVNHPNSTRMKDLYHLLNSALGSVHLSGHSSMFCPMTLRGGLGLRPTAPVSFPFLSYDPSLWYHSSAVLALALDAITAPYRLRTNSATMWQLSDTLTVAGRKVVSAYGAVPFPMMHGGSLPDALSPFSKSLPWKPLSSCPEAGDGRCFGQWATLKGFEGQRLVSSLAPGNPPPSALHSLHSGEDVLGSYLSSFYPNSPLALQLVSSPSKLTAPFPQMFDPRLDTNGLLHGQTPQTGTSVAPVASAPVLTSLQSSPGLGSWLSDLHRTVSSLDVRRVAPSFLCQGLEEGDYSEALEQLKLLSRCYRDDSGGATRSSSEDDDDD